MVDDLTKSVHSASISARITAFLSITSLVSWTILIDDALRISTAGYSVDNATLTIRTTRRGIAWIGWFFLFDAQLEWISYERRWTTTDRAVVDHVTLSVESTHSHAWVDAFGVDAGFVPWTVGADGTLRSATTTSGVAEETWQAFADRILSQRFAYSVYSAW